MTDWTSFAIRWLLDQEKVRVCIEAKEGQPLDETGNNNDAMDTGGDALHFQQPQAAESDCWEKSETVTPDLLYKVIFQPWPLLVIIKTKWFGQSYCPTEPHLLQTYKWEIWNKSFL